MTDPVLTNCIVAGLVGMGFGVGGRIVFDWLKNRNGNASSPDIHHVLGSSECFKWKTGIDTCLATHEIKIEDHEKRLDKGSKDFEGIKKSIAGIDTSMAVFAEKIEKEGL